MKSQMCICLRPEFDCPEVTLCGWQDIKIQLLTYLLYMKRASFHSCFTPLSCAPTQEIQTAASAANRIVTCPARSWGVPVATACRESAWSQHVSTATSYGAGSMMTSTCVLRWVLPVLFFLWETSAGKSVVFGLFSDGDRYQGLAGKTAYLYQRKVGQYWVLWFLCDAHMFVFPWVPVELV